MSEETATVAIRKVVINGCFGGFGLSHEGVMRYAEIKGLTLYPETKDDAIGRLCGPTYWLAPKGKRAADQSTEDWCEWPMERRKAYNEAYEREVLTPRDIARDDPVLVQTVEELGEKVNGRCNRLEIVEIPADVDWQIDEYDGNEWVAEKHRRWPE